VARLSPLRSLLYVPGNRERFFAKLPELRADAVIFDLEDAVPPAEKAAARSTVRGALRGLGRGDMATFVRVNPSASGLAAADVEAVVCDELDGLVVPKVESGGDVRVIADWLDDAEARAGLQQGRIAVIAILESVRGVLNAVAIAAAEPRLLGLAFGSEDFSRDLGVERTKEGIEALYPRAHVALAARGAGLQALDTPWSDIADVDGLRRETWQGRQLGYTGKQVIHPSQIVIVHSCYAPSSEELCWAERVIAAYEGALEQGRGALQLEGKLIDAPMVARARRLLARARGDE
jgi:citrate lyase subunit beta/citryl-CoA lyase